MNRIKTPAAENSRRFLFSRGRMRRYRIVSILLSMIVIIGSSCVSEPGIDKTKFSELTRTVEDLKSAIASGRPCDASETMQQRFISGIAVLKDKTASKAEIDLMKAYAHLLITYQDGLLLCQYLTQLPQYQFVPKGNIYVFQELDPLVQKYALSTESHLYRPTGVYWRSIEGDSIKIIWKSVESQIKNIENVVNYN